MPVPLYDARLVSDYWNADMVPGNVHEAKTLLSRLLSRVAPGEKAKLAEAGKPNCPTSCGAPVSGTFIGKVKHHGHVF